MAFNLIALGLTFGAILFAMIALTAVAIVPIIVAYLPIDDTLRSWLAYSRWPILGVFILLALDVVYRFGPSRSHPQWHLISVGTVFAVVVLDHSRPGRFRSTSRGSAATIRPTARSARSSSCCCGSGFPP